MNRPHNPARPSRRALFVALALCASPALSFAQQAPAPAASVARAIVPAQTEALLQAIKKGNWDAARAAVEAGADINAQDKKGITVLMRAASEKQADLVQMLLENGANPNALDREGRSALHYAVPQAAKKKRGWGKMLGGLAGGAIGGKIGDLAGGSLTSSLLGNTPLGDFMGGNLQSLLAGQIFDLSGKGGWKAIAGAALQGDAGGKFNIAALLSGDLSKLDAGKWTSLLSAARGGKPEILAAMSRLGEGAAPEVLGNWKQFLDAASSGDAATVDSLLKQPELAGLLGKAGGGLQAAANELPGNAPRAIITALIDNGANIAAANRDGQTPAALALKSGQKILAELLGAPETGSSTPAEDSE